MENKIAVIIPAYKDTYLLNTLISINNQTDKKFNLYICNDSSPYNIEKVLADFKKINKIHFEYIKFENNLGGSDLIQHWNRCINQIKNEEWIWLFSDDDLMEDNCIRDLNHQINLGIKEDVIYFNINIILLFENSSQCDGAVCVTTISIRKSVRMVFILSVS